MLTPEGEPAADSIVIVLPVKDSLGVALADKQLRDPYDEQWSPTDAEGRYTIYLESDDYVLAILHPEGCDVRPGPAKDKPPTIRLEPWATVTFSTTGGIDDQNGDVTVRPAALAADGPQFHVYEVRVKDKAVSVPVPPGRVSVSRSLKMGDGVSIGLPVEQFELKPGENRDVAVEPPTDADRAKAAKFHEQFHVRPAKPNREGGAKANVDEAKDKAAPAELGTVGYVEIDPETQRPVATGRAVEVDPETQKPKVQSKPDNASELTAAEQATAEKAVARLRELGAIIEPARVQSPSKPEPIKSLADPVRVTLQDWKGTADDLKLLADLPNVRGLMIFLDRVPGKVLNGLKLPRPIEELLLGEADDEKLAVIDSLPACRRLVLNSCSLTPASCQHLAEFAADVPSLQLVGPPPDGHADAKRSGITDDGLKFIGELRGLRTLNLFMLDITDAGLAHLAGLENLKSMSIAECPGIKGSGLASLKPLANLRR